MAEGMAEEMKKSNKWKETPIYKSIASRMENTSLPLVLLGAKGVGKTTTLMMLYESCKRPKHYFNLSSDLDVARLSEKLKTLASNKEKECPVWLFVDNIHELVNYECLNGLIRMYVKCWAQYRDLARLVCAVSRYGLVGLVHKFRINYCDLNTKVVNPTEDVAWWLVEQSNEKMISDPANEPKIREFFEYVGFVPRLVQLLIEGCNNKDEGQDIETIIANLTYNITTDLRSVLSEDIQSTNPASRSAHICALALCVARGLPCKELPNLVHRQNVSWTFLKETSEGLLTSVSPLATHVVKLHLSTDVLSQNETVELLKQANLKGESNVRGYIFEALLLWKFTSASAHLTLLGKTKDDKKHVNLTTLSQAGVVLNQKVLPPMFTPAKNICYVTPNMKGADFILSLESEVYFIQCTVNKELMSVKASFWNTCPSEWEPVLITVFDVENTKQRLLDSNGALSNEFKNGKFYIGDAKTLLTEQSIQLCSPASE